MNKILVLLTILSCMISCQNKEKQEENNLKELQKQAQELMKNQIDFFRNATPKYFSATTINGKLFNSQDLKNKNFVVFIYDKSYLKKSDTYDMTKELNEIYIKTKSSLLV